MINELTMPPLMLIEFHVIMPINYNIYNSKLLRKFQEHIFLEIKLC